MEESWGVRLVGACAECGANADGCVDMIMPTEEAAEATVRTVPIHKNGGSLAVYLTRELRELGLDRGDRVEVGVRPARRGRAGPPPLGPVLGRGCGGGGPRLSATDR